MTRFIKKIIFYTLLLISFFSAFTWIGIRGLQLSEFGNLKEWKEILEGKVNADVLIQGSSRAWVHFDTRLIDSTLKVNSYNAGMDGAPFDIQYIRWKAYMANNSLPRILFQQVDLDLLERNKEVFQKYQYLPFQRDPDLRRWLIQGGILDTADRIFPFSMLMGQPQAIKVGLESFLGINRHPSIRYKGFAAHPGSWKGDGLQVLKNSSPRHWVVDEELLLLFEQFLEECKSLNIRVVLVYSPMYEAIESVVNDFEGSVKLYQTLAAKHDVEFYDFSLTDISKVKSNFYNTTHLNKTGATEFTRQLISITEQYR